MAGSPTPGTRTWRRPPREAVRAAEAGTQLHPERTQEDGVPGVRAGSHQETTTKRQSPAALPSDWLGHLPCTYEGNTTSEGEERWRECSRQVRRAEIRTFDVQGAIAKPVDVSKIGKR